MIDLLYLTHNRRAFTEASVAALLRNTDWSQVQRLYLYDDCSTDGAREVLDATAWPVETIILTQKLGGPVSVMNHFLQVGQSPVFAKLDNDVIVPPGWLTACLQVMEQCPALDLLGIEPPASRTKAPWARVAQAAPELSLAAGYMGYAQCDSIGGIGLMRRKAWARRSAMLPHGPNGVGGFTDWQHREQGVVRGWIAPPLAVFLLDRLPLDPWASLSREYIAKGWQRPWTNYRPEDSALWDWWTG